MAPSQKKPGSTKTKDKQPPEPLDDTASIDWEKADSTDVPQATKEGWYNSAAEAIRKESLDAFKVILKSIQPVSSLIHVFQQHRQDFWDIDIIKLAVVRGCKPIVDCMITALSEVKFHELAVWGQYSAIHIAAIWGHVDLVERFHEFHLKLAGDPLVNGVDTVTSLALRYGHVSIVEYYAWYDLRVKYVRILESLLRHLRKAVPQHDLVFTADDIDRYQAGCEEKMEAMKTVKFASMPMATLLSAVREACHMRFRVETIHPKPEDMPKDKGKGGAKGKKKK